MSTTKLVTVLALTSIAAAYQSNPHSTIVYDSAGASIIRTSVRDNIIIDHAQACFS